MFRRVREDRYIFLMSIFTFAALIMTKRRNAIVVLVLGISIYTNAQNYAL